MLLVFTKNMVTVLTEENHSGLYDINPKMQRTSCMKGKRGYCSYPVTKTAGVVWRYFLFHIFSWDSSHMDEGLVALASLFTSRLSVFTCTFFWEPSIYWIKIAALGDMLQFLWQHFINFQHIPILSPPIKLSYHIPITAVVDESFIAQ